MVYVLEPTLPPVFPYKSKLLLNGFLKLSAVTPDSIKLLCAGFIGILFSTGQVSYH